MKSRNLPLAWIYQITNFWVVMNIQTQMSFWTKSVHFCNVQPLTPPVSWSCSSLSIFTLSSRQKKVEAVCLSKKTELEIATSFFALSMCFLEVKAKEKKSQSIVRSWLHKKGGCLGEEEHHSTLVALTQPSKTCFLRQLRYFLRWLL